MRRVKKKQHTQIYTIDLIQEISRDILDFWRNDLGCIINIMDIETIPNHIKQKVKSKFKYIFKYLEKGNLFDCLHINVDTYYACIILFTLYSRIMYKKSIKMYKNDKKIYLFMEMGLNIYNIKINKELELNNINKLALLLPFQISENVLHQIQGKQIIYLYLFKCINIKQTIRKILHYQHKRIDTLEKYNRFPNRNKILKREFTIEEIDYLDEMYYNNFNFIF